MIRFNFSLPDKVSVLPPNFAGRARSSVGEMRGQTLTLHLVSVQRALNTREWGLLRRTPSSSASEPDRRMTGDRPIEGWP